MSKIDYDLTKIKGFVFDVDGVLSPSTIPMDENGAPRRMINIKDGYAIQLAIKHGFLVSIISGGVSSAIVSRYNALGVKDVFMGATMKLPVLHQWLWDHSLERDEIVFVGDDVPDYECMRFVNLSVAPADAAADIKKVARYISPCKGGYGVARDVIEEVMRAQGEWMSTEKAFGW